MLCKALSLDKTEIRKSQGLSSSTPQYLMFGKLGLILQKSEEQ